jgi:hypothetical protein
VEKEKDSDINAGNILIVDDEPVIVSSIMIMLDVVTRKQHPGFKLA